MIRKHYEPEKQRRFEVQSRPRETKMKNKDAIRYLDEDGKRRHDEDEQERRYEQRRHCGRR